MRNHTRKRPVRSTFTHHPPASPALAAAANWVHAIAQAAELSASHPP